MTTIKNQNETNQVREQDTPSKKTFTFPIKEADLLQGLTPYTVHADELAVVTHADMSARPNAQ
ncbi:MAG: hypothetical protein MJK04_22750 [Psychrosphaera sp.]|nr:hypothetical protein [Psychrosphaera sp.]